MIRVMVAAASLLLTACATAPVPPPSPGATSILEIAGGDSAVTVWPDRTVERRTTESVIRRRLSERQMARLEELLRKGPSATTGYRSYVAPQVTETHVTVALPERSYRLVTYPPACRVPEGAASFSSDGGVTDEASAFVEELFRHLPVKRCP